MPRRGMGGLRWGERVPCSTQVRVHQGTLSRTGQEREPAVCDLRVSESVPGAQATVVRFGRIVPHEAAEPPSRGQKQTASLVGRTKPPATRVSALRLAVKITCSEIP